MQLVIDEKVLSVQTTMGEGIMIMMITQLQDQLRSDILETGKKKKVEIHWNRNFLMLESQKNLFIFVFILLKRLLF